MPKNHTSLKFRLKDGLAATILRSVLRLSALVPLEVARSAGRFVGRLAFRMNTQTVRVVRRNIELAYPQLPADQQAALMKEAVLEQGALTAELGHVWRRSLPTSCPNLGLLELSTWKLPQRMSEAF